MNKFKVVIKGKESNFTVKLGGDINYAISAMSQIICEIAIKNGVTKKEILEDFKNSFEATMKALNEGGM